MWPPPFSAIWAHLLARARTRAWLLDARAPPPAHVVPALLSAPLLIGVGVCARDAARPVAALDVGDLCAALYCDGPVILGFIFGLDRIHPVMRIVYHVTRDPRIADVRVVVRRIARMVSPFPGPPAWICLEFDWLESGVLSVCSTVHLRSEFAQDSQYPPLVASETRVFCAAIAKELRENSSDGALPDICEYMLSSVHSSPDGPCDVDGNQRCSVARMQQHGSLKPLLDLREDGSNGRSPDAMSTAGADAFGNIPTAGDPVSSSHIPENNFLQLWCAFQRDVKLGSSAGLSASRLFGRHGGTLQQIKSIGDALIAYHWLSATGLVVGGRIQNLCVQLGVDCSSPHCDEPVLHVLQESEVRAEDEAAASGMPSPMEAIRDESWAGHSENHWGDTKSSLAWCSEWAEEVSPNPSPGPSTPSISCGYCTEINAPESDEKFEAVVSHERDNDSIPSPSSARGAHCEDEMSHWDAVRMATSSVISVDPTSRLLNSKPQTENRNVRDQLRFTPSPVTDSCVEGLREETAGQVAVLATVDVQTAILDRDSFDNTDTPTGVKTAGGWKCDLCGKVLRGKKGNLNRHIANTHMDERKFACAFAECDRRFHTRLNRERHEKSVHSGCTYSCDQCTRSFKTEERLVDHVSVSHSSSGGTYICELCGHCFGQRSTLKRHLSSKIHEAVVRPNVLDRVGPG